jgi:hypothetical protein
MLVSDNVWQILSEYFWNKLKALKDQCLTLDSGSNYSWQLEIQSYLLSLSHRVGMQRAKLFLKSSELGLPNPSPAGECAPTALHGSGGRGTLAGEKGGGRVPIPTRVHTLWYSLYIYELCALIPPGSRVYLLASLDPFCCHQISLDSLKLPPQDSLRAYEYTF